MTERREDKAFEDFLDGRSPLSESYARLKDVEPPAEIDRRVLAEARSEVRHAARATSRKAASWWRPWPAIATVVMVGMAVMLSLDLLRTQSFHVEQMPMESPRRAESAGRPSAEISALEQDEPTAGAPGMAADDRGGMTADRLLRKQETQPDTARTRSATPAPARPAGRSDEIQSDGPPSAYASADPATTDASGATHRLEVDSAGPATAGRSLTGNRTTGLAMGDAAALSMTAVSESGQRDILAEALAVARLRVAERRREQDDGRFVPVPESETSPDRTAGAIPAPQAQEEVSPESTLGEDPELWLELIDVLLETGHDGIANEQTRVFRESFPDHPLSARHEALLND